LKMTRVNLVFFVLSLRGVDLKPLPAATAPQHNVKSYLASAGSFFVC
jgi:hypothetical protein